VNRNRHHEELREPFGCFTPCGYRSAIVQRFRRLRRTVDVHALRHTFGTHLSKAGVAPRVAQAAMRHSSIDLTMNVYTDPLLLDVHGALDSLPTLSLDGAPQSVESNEARATGTDDVAAVQFAPEFAPKSGNPSQSWSIVGNTDDLPSDSKKK